MVTIDQLVFAGLRWLSPDSVLLPPRSEWTSKQTVKKHYVGIYWKTTIQRNQSRRQYSKINS